MLIYRNSLFEINKLIEKKAQFHFSIDTQYKLLKLKKAIKEEIEIYNIQLSSFEKFFEKDCNGNYIKQDSGFKIKKEYIKDCEEKIEELNNSQAQIPDLYFSLDELVPLDLTLYELELLEPFIKN